MGERINQARYIITLCGHRTFVSVLCLIALCLTLPSAAQNKTKGGNDGKKKAEWVYLDHADDLSYDMSARPGIQVAKGNVKFRFEDNTLDCDSAYLNQFQNTFEAFGNVRMHRTSDNATLTSDYAKYTSMTRIFNARRRVVLTQPGNTLHCDSLDYNANNHTAFYYGNGRLTGDGTTIISERGDYNTKSHDAHFSGKKVTLRSPQYNITTPTLSYNTETKDGHVQGPSVIRTSNGEVVHTDNADFNGFAHSFSTHGHSTITSPVRDIEGDNMDYDRSAGYGEGHGHVKVVDKQAGRTITGDNVKFHTANVVENGKTRNELVEYEGEGNSKIVDRPAQRTVMGDYLRYNTRTKVGEGRGNVDYIDHRRKNAFLGDYVHYTELDAIAYGRAVAKDFSQSADTMFIHADTIVMKGNIVERADTDIITGDTIRIVPDTLRTLYGIDNVRAYRTDVQGVCGLLIAHTSDSTMTMYQDPIVWNGSHQLLGDSIRCFMNDSTIREAHVMGHAFSIELMRDGEHYNQVSSKIMKGYFVDGKIRRGEAIGNVYVVYYPVDDTDSSLIGLNYTETDTMRLYMNEMRKLQKIWMPKSKGTLYPMNQIPANKLKLRGFAWYDYIRPLNKYDIFRHATKADKALFRKVSVSKPPLQYIGKLDGKGGGEDGR